MKIEITDEMVCRFSDKLEQFYLGDGRYDLASANVRELLTAALMPPTRRWSDSPKEERRVGSGPLVRPEGSITVDGEWHHRRAGDKHPFGMPWRCHERKIEGGTGRPPESDDPFAKAASEGWTRICVLHSRSGDFGGHSHRRKEDPK